MASIVIMGVAGCGKSTFGQALAQALNLPWIEGDDFHSEHSKAKMAAGTPLEDSDRHSWLLTLARILSQHPQGCVLGCSALKRSYREVLRQSGPLQFAFLRLSLEQAQQRVRGRAGHFFSDTLVDSQFATLEEPDPLSEHDVMVLDATLPTSVLLAQVLAPSPT